MLHPGHVLTSMLKRVDVAVYKAFDDVAKNQWSAGTQTLGLKEDGVGYAVDENNKDLLTPEMTAAVEKAKGDIISGAVQVHNYNSDNNCPY
jgi:basic membrane protein A and related proteins